MNYMLTKLNVWKAAIELCTEINQIISRFPETEKFNLTVQMRRTSSSISSNIAEGSGRRSAKDKRRFYAIAYGSSTELRSHIELARRYLYIKKFEYDLLIKLLTKVQKLLCSLHKKPTPNFKL